MVETSKWTWMVTAMSIPGHSFSVDSVDCPVTFYQQFPQNNALDMWNLEATWMKMHAYIQAIWNLALASKDLNHEKYKICREWHAEKIRWTTLMGLVFYRFFFGHCRVNAYVHLDLWPQVHRWFLASTSSTQRATLLNIYGAPAKYPTLLELVNRHKDFS